MIKGTKKVVAKKSSVKKSVMAKKAKMSVAQAAGFKSWVTRRANMKKNKNK